jgi:hypothetical protein
VRRLVVGSTTTSPRLFATMAPLGDVAKAAHAALWQQRHGGRTLAKELVQDKLNGYFAGRGEAVVDLPIDVDVDDVEGWRVEWRAIAASAGIDDEVDRERLIKFLEKRSAGPVGIKATGVAAKALETLESHGVTLTHSIISDLEKNLALGEAGDAQAQSTSCLCVGILFTGAPFEADDEERWIRLHSALAPGKGGQIDICRFPGYISLMSKSANLTLERALKSQALWDQYYEETQDRLETNGLPKAATMLHSVVMQCTRQSQGNEVKKRDFLRGYFFDEFRGLGMPERTGVRSALAIMGDVAGSRSIMPTTCTNYDLALSGLAGQQASVGPSASMDLARLMGGSAPSCASFSGGGSVVGGSIPSSAGALSIQDMASAVARELSQAGLGLPGLPTPALPAPLPLPPPSSACQFCEKTGCSGDCSQARRAFQLFRADIKQRAAKAKARADAERARQEE